MDDTNQTGRLPQAKLPITVLAGPYGHPFHPVLVTVPIGAWVAGVVFDIVALVNSEDESVFAEGAYWLIGIGIVGAVLAAVFGLASVVGFVISLIALSLLGVSGWLGGKLAYHYGVRVASEETQQEGFR